MQPFIRYLYECKGEKRVRNVGFVKAEQQSKQQIIQIHGKGLDAGADKKIEVVVLCEKEGQLIGAPQGSVECNLPVLHSVLTFDANDVGGEELFSCVIGILLKNQEGVQYVALWEEKQQDLADLIWLEKWVEPERKPEPEPEMEIEEYIFPKNRTYEKIKRQDLARLPRKDWKMANNHFLLHGFYNYHHLLYITEEEHVWIGVPGIYHEKEEAVAKAFGFPQFHRLTDAQVELDFDETDTVEDFGYWCRMVV